MRGSITTNPNLRLLNALKQGDKAIGTFMLFKGARTAQVVARTGLDAVIIDCEHGNIDDSSMHDMVSSISGSGVSPVIRVPELGKAVIKRALDTGTHGILIPMINTAAEARSAVSLIKFPPLGARGQGSPFACFEHGLSTPSEYVAKANDTVITMIQIETVAGVENIQEICQVDGIDIIFIGPNDLALALLGYTPAKYTESVFLEAIDKVITDAKKYGKKVAIPAVNGEAAKKAMERVDFVILGADARVLQAWYGRELAIARSDLS
ncbi:hypothetical protein Plec18167_000508 [Paecilomyces lecythidis]|uniref:HpcH/HpaI aldolase/citrate lyase domain-containing protein n=1 Tax=Paecilomyces lecythidis TaxID=3004212 RepID=A0ABR3YE56_9EURO